MSTKKEMEKLQFGVLGSSASTSYVQNQFHNLIIIIDPMDATSFLKDIILLQWKQKRYNMHSQASMGALLLARFAIVFHIID